MNIFKSYILAVLIVMTALPCQCAVKIKFATLAPIGSTWMKVMDSFAKEVSQKTSKAIKFKIYAGGVQGDERDIIRKIRLGQLHAGGFTGVGLGEIAHQIRVLDAPFLFKSADEIDYIYSKFDTELRNMLEKKGYILLGWTEVGFVYLFTNTAVSKPKDLRKVKMWMWESDMIALATFKAMKISPVPLSITDVMTSLQTGLINGVYGSPLSVVALQWFTRIKYMLSLPIANASGAVLISKKKFNQLKPEHQKVLLESGKKYFKKLTILSRKDNQKSIETLKKADVEIIKPVSHIIINRFELMGEQARKSLIGRLYSRELLERVETALADFRKSNKK